MMDTEKGLNHEFNRFLRNNFKLYLLNLFDFSFNLIYYFYKESE